MTEICIMAQERVNGRPTSVTNEILTISSNRLPVTSKGLFINYGEGGVKVLPLQKRGCNKF